MKRIVEAEQRGERTTAVIGPFAAWTIIGFLQLAARHPGLQDDSFGMQVIHGFVDQLKPLFAGTPGERIIELGWDPANDPEP